MSAGVQRAFSFLFSLCRHLSIKRCYRVGKVGIKSLCDSFPSLLTLDISECCVTSDCLVIIAENMVQLQYLNIANCVRMDSVESADELLSKLQTNCSQLKVLTVSNAQLHLDEDPRSEWNGARLNHLTFIIDFVPSCNSM